MSYALLEEELSVLRDKNLYRQLKTLQPIDAVHAQYQGFKQVLFCGNDYLGLSFHPKVKDAVEACLESGGVGAGASRLISGTTEQHQALEKQVAQFKNKEKALVFSAGYLANLGTLSALANEDDLIVMDKLCHASLIDGMRLSGATIRVFPHLNYERCEELFSKRGEYRKAFLVTESVFSMDGDLADLKRCIDIKNNNNAYLVVDDAHATGVFGIHGSGLLEDLQLEDQVDIITGTFSKALGCLGGYVATNEIFYECLVNQARSFIFATALPPILCAALSQSIKIVEEDDLRRKTLWQNIQLFHNAMEKTGHDLGPIQSPIIPIIIGDEEKTMTLAMQLLEKGFFVPGIRYPTVAKGKARLRVTISSEHSLQEIKDLAQQIAELLAPKSL